LVGSSVSRLGVFVRLLRFPGLLLAIVGATAVVSVVTVTGALFLDVAASATLTRTVEADGAYRLATAAIAADTPVVDDIVAYRTHLLERELSPTFGPALITARGDVVVASHGDEAVEVRLISRTDALSNVTVLERSGTAGAWLADVTATALGAEAGDELTFAGNGTETTVPVAGIYRDVLAEPRNPFWASLDDFIYPRPGADTRPPVPVLLELDDYLAVDQALLDDQDAITWEFLLPSPPVSIQEAERLRGVLLGFGAPLSDQSSEVGAAFTAVGFTEPLSGWLDLTNDVIDQIGPPVRALMLAVVVLALAVLGGAGVFVVRRRRVEYALLDARGVALWRIAGRTVGEVLLPVALGVGLGWLGGLLIVDAVSGEGVSSEDVVSTAVRSVLIVGGCAVVLLALVVARSVADLSATERGGVRRAAARAPWEVVVLVLAVLAFVGLRSGDTGGPIDPLFLLFPVLVLAGTVGLVVRGLRRLLPALRSTGTSWATAPYLAVRRLTAATRGALALLTVSAVAIGVLVYAGTVAASLQAAADEAAGLAVGSDVAVSYAGSFDGDGAAIALTDVGRIERSGLQGDDVQLDVLLVDPATFADAAFWRDGFSDVSLEELMARLDEDPDPRVPIVVAGDVRAQAQPVLRLPGFDVPARVVGTASAFPGMVGDRPVVVADRDAIELVVEASDYSLERFLAETQVWGRGSEAEVVEATAAGGASVLSSVSAAALRDTPEYLAIASMLRLLIAVGAVAGSVVFVVSALYLAARQRQAEVAYALSRRMGLARGTSRRSLLLEVLGLLGVAFVMGSLVAVAASLTVYADTQARVVDITAPVFRLPLGLLAATVVVLVAFAVLATTVVQRRADGADVAEVMRGA
jgi:putative ABC transport system permease protein